MTRLKKMYQEEIIPRLMKENAYKTVMAVPKLEKITVNIGVGEAIQNAKALDAAIEDLRTITGQQPIITRARKSISNFKLRQGMAIGCSVTLRRARMYEFFDRLVNFAMPRIRDFRGISTKSCDGRGNFIVNNSSWAGESGRHREGLLYRNDMGCCVATGGTIL